jgi:hypothetical protein
MTLKSKAAAHANTILRSVYDFVGEFVAFPDEHCRLAVAVWVLHAHLMDRWESTPRLAFLSAEPASGKTRALEILELLVPSPVQAVNVSPAFLFRRAASGDGPPTILFDEIDSIFGPKAKENEELRAFINAGHRKGAKAGRCVVRGNVVTTEELPAYCAIAVAGLGWLPDTILSRSVIIRMRRRHAGERIAPFRRREHAPRGKRLYDQIERWARQQPAVIADWPEMPPEIQDRDADVWEALLAVADAVGGEWPERARKAAVALVAASKEVEPSLGVRLLSDIKLIFEGDAMSSKAILHRLLELEEAPWKDLKGKPLDERGLAYRLRQYSIKSKTIRVGEATPKGYVKVDFDDPWTRYLPPPEKSATSATGATDGQFLAVIVDNVADVADLAEAVALQGPEKGNGRNDVADVADVAQFARSSQRRCAQCGASDDGKLLKFGGVFLHKECRRFWNGDPQRPA